MPVVCMNQFERETLRFAGALFATICILFPFLRSQLWLWSSLPRCVMLASLGWLASALVVVGAPRMALLQGLLFELSYFVIVLASAPLLAAGMFEVVLGLYASFKTGGDEVCLPARPHFLACLTCLGRCENGCTTACLAPGRLESAFIGATVGRAGHGSASCLGRDGEIADWMLG
jgi:hypothetical protein